MLRIVLALGLALAPPDDARVFEIVPTPLPEPDAREPVAPAQPVSAPPPAPLVPPPPELVEVDPTNYRIVLVGDVLVGLGGVGFLVMCAGLVVYNEATQQRRNQAVGAEAPDDAELAPLDRRVALGTNLALVGGVSAAVLFASGIGMIIGGRRRERARREALVVDAAPGGLRVSF
jgi:hypothetical protein